MKLPEKILIATGNKNKFVEFQEIIKNIPASRNFSADGLIFAPDYAHKIIQVEETGATYLENAIIKAQAWSKISGLASLADDSGLEAEALNGEPGIFSNRIIKGSDADKIQKRWHINQMV